MIESNCSNHLLRDRLRYFRAILPQVLSDVIDDLIFVRAIQIVSLEKVKSFIWLNVHENTTEVEMVHVN